MYTFVPLSLLNIPVPLADCRLVGTTCYLALVTDYDASAWSVTDYLHGTYCVGLRERSVWCAWGRK